MSYTNDKEPGKDKSRGLVRLRNIPRILINVAVALGVLVALSMIVLGVSKSGYMDTRGYMVKGNSFLTGEEVFALSGLEMGSNLYSVNIGKIENRLEGDPRISSSVVRRRFPDTIIIEVEETAPVAVMNIDGALFKVGGDGTIIAPLNGQYEDLPYIFGFEADIEFDETPVGKKIAGSDIELGLDVASKVADCPALGIEVSAIRVDKRVLYLGADRVIVRYDAGFDSKQVSRLNRIWSILPRNVAPYEIDVRYGNDIIVRGL